MKALDLFMNKFIPEPNSGCWLWTGCGDRRDYGYHQIKGKTIKAHRFSYNAFIGEIPENLHVLHKCDVTCCVNPDHLFVGSHRVNMDDMVKKGRSPRLLGENHGMVKLSEEDVVKIRDMRGTHKEIAKEFNISRQLVGFIKSGKRWRHI